MTFTLGDTSLMAAALFVVGQGILQIRQAARMEQR